MKMIYLAGALRGNFVKKWINIRKAKKIAKYLWLHNIAVLCPHLNSGWIDNFKTDEFILQANIEFMKRCDVVIVINNWGNSEGTKTEIRHAIINGIPIFFDLKHAVDCILNNKLDEWKNFLSNPFEGLKEVIDENY